MKSIQKYIQIFRANMYNGLIGYLICNANIELSERLMGHLTVQDYHIMIKIARQIIEI